LIHGLSCQTYHAVEIVIQSESSSVGGGERLDHDERYGTLWRHDFPGAGEPIMMVEVVNSTLEPDGSRKRHWLRMPPEMQMARQAVHGRSTYLGVSKIHSRKNLTPAIGDAARRRAPGVARGRAVTRRTE
jgi:hypothetical protein